MVPVSRVIAHPNGMLSDGYDIRRRHLPGDSGGPIFGRNAAGALRVAGATSHGEGCARPGKPGVYARVGDSTLREWIRQQAPNGVGG